MESNGYNPDVLNCIANLSNDEVFTPPIVANRMLDLLPPELFSNPSTRFLDPFCKSGVFLREIVKRLDIGLAEQIPDRKERITHIMHNQVFGIAITELTSLLARRTVYCCKDASNDHSVVHFDSAEGNIRYRAMRHTWRDGKCTYCGASRDQYERGKGQETYAYQFIHTDNPKKIFKMDFDVIIGNPPYQMSDGGAQASAIPIYNLFVQQAKKLNPHYLIMIIPSRWFAGGRGLDDFRNEMLHDTSISEIVDYPISTECFAGVEIKGGVCYFLRDSYYHGNCKITTIRGEKKSIDIRPLLEKSCNSFIRYNEAVSIYRKVNNHHEETFDKFVSSMKPFGLRTYVQGSKHFDESSVKLYANRNIGYIHIDEILSNKAWIDKYKIFISRAYGAGEDFPHQILNTPLLGEPNSCCTETYLVIGPFEDKKTTENVISYIHTRFFRFMVMLKKNTQDAPARVYSMVPLQDFSKPWTDKELYAKYNLSDDEIHFIESMIKPMEE